MGGFAILVTKIQILFQPKSFNNTMKHRSYKEVKSFMADSSSLKMAIQPQNTNFKTWYRYFSNLTCVVTKPGIPLYGGNMA